jgi:hypothetical protein
MIDDIARIIASPIPRRQALRLLSGVVGGGILASLGLGRASRALGAPAGCPSSRPVDCNGICYPKGYTCCAKVVACRSHEQCCTDHCCEKSATCCGKRCCRRGHTCSFNSICCRPHEVACGTPAKPRCCWPGRVCCEVSGVYKCCKAGPSAYSPCTGATHCV